MDVRVDEDGTEAVRNDKHVKPVYVEKAPVIKDKKTWADAVKNTNNKDMAAACKPCRKDGTETVENNSSNDSNKP